MNDSPILIASYHVLCTWYSAKETRERNVVHGTEPVGIKLTGLVKILYSTVLLLSVSLQCGAITIVC